MIAWFNDSTLVKSVWTYRSYAYFCVTSNNLTLQLLMTLNNKCEWYFDDVSVKTSVGTEVLINENFENSTLLGWTTSTCSPYPPGISNSRSRSSVQSYRNRCQSQSILLFQSFPAASGEYYNISLWFYLDQISGGSGTGFNELQIILQWWVLYCIGIYTEDMIPTNNHLVEDW